MSVLWTTHLLDEVQADDDLLVLNRGRLVAQGSVASLALDGEDLAASFARLTGERRAGAGLDGAAHRSAAMPPKTPEPAGESTGLASGAKHS